MKLNFLNTRTYIAETEIVTATGCKSWNGQIRWYPQHGRAIDILRPSDSFQFWNYFN